MFSTLALDSKWSHLQRRQLCEGRAERVGPLEVKPREVRQGAEDQPERPHQVLIPL